MKLDKINKMAIVKEHKEKLKLTTDINVALEKGKNERNALALIFQVEGMSSEAVFNRLKILDKDLIDLFKSSRDDQLVRFDSVVDAESGSNLPILNVYVLLRTRVVLKNSNALKIVKMFRETFPASNLSAATPTKKILLEDKGLVLRDQNRYATADVAGLRLANAIVVLQIEKFALEKKNLKADQAAKANKGADREAGGNRNQHCEDHGHRGSACPGRQRPWQQRQRIRRATESRPEEVIFAERSCAFEAPKRVSNAQ